MARPLRFVPAGSVVEVTCRTIQGRWLLRPSPKLNDLLLGVLGRALSLYPSVQLHAFVFLSNHVHLLVSVPDACALAAFMNHFSSNVAREAGRLHGWFARLWSRRYRAIVVADDTAQVQRLRYILAHGAKEGLVARPAQWPGASCLGALTRGAPLSGTWIDRSRQGTAGPKGAAHASACRTRYQIALAPLPCWRERDAQERQAQCRALVSEIERELSGRPGGKSKTKVLGVASVLRKHPHSRPDKIKMSPAPKVHATSDAVRAAFMAAHEAFMELFSAAGQRLDSANLWPDFPSLAFPPRLRWGPGPAPA